ncbi:MAG: tetratricopeptide repeat protein [bacterium]
MGELDDDDFAATDEQPVARLLAEVRAEEGTALADEDAADDPGASYGASTAGGLLAGDSMEIVSAGIDFDAPPAGHTLEAVYRLDAVAGDRHTWGVDSLQMEAIRHGPVTVDEDERRYALEPMVPQGPTDPRGIYGTVTLPQLLYRCFSDLFTGRLIIRRGPVRKQVILSNGRPIGAESNIRSESLGYLLLRDGVIDQAQLAQSVRVARQMGIRQGEALVRIGAITAEALPDYLRRQLRGRLLGCFAWSGADYGLVYEPDVRAAREAVELNPLVLIFDGIKTSFPVGPLVHHFDARNRSPVRATERLRDYATMLRPFADDLRVAALCDGQRTLGEVLSASPFSLIDTLRVLRALEITGCVEFGEARAPDLAAEVRGPLTPRATVGGSLDGSMSGVVASRRSRRTISEPPPPPASTQTVDVVDSDDEMPSEVDLERIRRVATRRRRSRVMETGPDLVQAETNFSKGKRALEGDALQEALAHFALACRQDPHEPLFRMYHAFARFQAAGSDKRARAEALDELKGAVDGAPDHDEGQVLLGHAWRLAGNAEAAAKHYRKALSLNRRNPQANQALREMEGRRALQERDPAGLFGKFFTRR